MSKPSSTKGPDGKPWPLPRVAVDTAEQLQWAFGYCPAPRLQEGARGPVHHGKVAESSLVNELLDGPWHCERANLFTADYQLLGPDGLPIDGLVAVERKSFGDLVGSLTKGRETFMAEMERLGKFRFPLVVVEAPIEALIGSRSGLLLALQEAWKGWGGALNAGGWQVFGESLDDLRRRHDAIGDYLEGIWAERESRTSVSARSLLGTLLSILTDHRIPVLLLPNRGWAEYTAAWALRRAWRRWLTEQHQARARTAEEVATP